MKYELKKIIGELCGYGPVHPQDVRGREIRNGGIWPKLRQHGVLVFEARDEERVIESLQREGAVAQPQYEAIHDGAADYTRLVTVAKASGSITSAGSAKHTDPHQDGYQFATPYKGIDSAGIGRLPDIELLGYPRVVEERWLRFYDLGKAALALLANSGERYMDWLKRPVYTVSDIYQQRDPALSSPGSFPVLFLDRLGVRFHMGGSVMTTNSKADIALAQFRDEMMKTMISTKAESDSLFVINQRIIAHRGVRIVGRNGLTVLTRVLMRFGLEI